MADTASLPTAASEPILLQADAPPPAPTFISNPTALHLDPMYADLIPIPQDDSPSPMVPIAYSPEYRSAMDLFRAVVKDKELSERVLNLTDRIIKINPAHYSVWAYRARTLLFLNSAHPEKNLINTELDLMDALVKAHLKSYQIWQHRREMVIVLGDEKRELPFVDKALGIDGKNYHTWAYRQWVLCHFNKSSMWEPELAFIDRMLTTDVRNNSAWNHRFFLQFESGHPQPPYSTPSAVAQSEIEWAKAHLMKAPNNPSAWNYLRGVLKFIAAPLSSQHEFVKPLMSASVQDAGVEELNPETVMPVVAAIEWVADAGVEDGRAGKNDGLGESVQLYERLTELDPIRKRYWAWRGNLAKKLLSASS